MPFTRVIVVAPGFGGADGASELTRQWVEALDGLAAATGASLEAWSLSEAARPAAMPARIDFHGAAGRAWRLASTALTSGAAGSDTLVVVLHVHLLPAVLPVIWRGARVLTVMLGIEVWKPLRPLERTGLRRSWRVSAISSHTVTRFRCANPDLADVPVSVCHPRVSAGAVAAADRAASAPFAGPFALIVGRMSAEERYKGHDVLIDVWPDVLSRVPDATLIVAGGGDDAARLERKAGDSGLAGRVVFPGPVTAAQLAALYRDAAFFVMPSAGEGFGIVYLEAMREGKPCIAGPGAAAEIITDGVDGLIVDPGDRAAVAGAVTKLFIDAPLRQRLGAAASARVAATFTAERFADRLAELVC
jgi:phosphatidylinositol alpha-1,6-mannosyltransferase